MWQKKYYVQNATGRGTSRLPRFIRNTRAHYAMEKVTSKNSPPSIAQQNKKPTEPIRSSTFQFLPNSFVRQFFIAPKLLCTKAKSVKII